MKYEYNYVKMASCHNSMVHKQVVAEGDSSIVVNTRNSFPQKLKIISWTTFMVTDWFLYLKTIPRMWPTHRPDDGGSKDL
jgi:hypothetical protein